MGLPRRFLNLLMENRNPGIQSLCCIDLDRQKLFNTRKPAQRPMGRGSESEGELQDATTWAPAVDAVCQKKVRRIYLPHPRFKFRAGALEYKWSMRCFPLNGRKVLCTDQSGRSLLFDGDSNHLVTLPDLHHPKSSPFSIFVPDADIDGGGRIYLMEGYPWQEPSIYGQLSHQFEAFVYCKSTLTPFTTSWQCQLLPPPPFVRDPSYWHRQPSISSYAVVDSGSHICISVDVGGTYCLDTAKHIWSKVGNWALPFRGKVEYVPELKLWFGLSAKDGQLAAADLSTILTMNSQPQLVGPWKEIEPPEEWKEMRKPDLVNLGSGRFCIARFFHTRVKKGSFLIEQYFTLLTGADVVPCIHDGNGRVDANHNGSRCTDCSADGGTNEVGLQMISHNSRRHVSYGRDGYIKAVF